MSEKCCCSGDCCDETAVPEITNISTVLGIEDYIGACKVRFGIGRDSYRVEPGLYAVGNPDNESPVLVSANYKLTFDILRKNLSGLNCWLLILDTKGVNVWCAAGKGTFGTDELVNRIEKSALSSFVSHKKLVLPQLGATGVSAHEVTKRTGYKVEYGPVRASDIKKYINAGYKASKEMRTVEFNLWDRLVLTPLQLVQSGKQTLPILGVILLTNQFAKRPFDKKDITACVGAVVTGAVTTPALLPYVPGKTFAMKGWLLGLGWTLGYLGLSGRLSKKNAAMSIGELLLLPSVSSFIAMDFTGSSTYTSPSGVQKEMKTALPFIIGSAALGSALMLGSHFFGRKIK